MGSRVKFVLFFIIFSTQSIAVLAQSNSFKIFDAIMIEDKPNLYLKGLSKINMVYEDSILSWNPKYPKVANERVYDHSKFNRLSKRLDLNYPICLDVESWSLEVKSIKKSELKYRNLLSKFKNKFGNREIGFYGVVPNNEVFLYQTSYSYASRFNRNWNNEWDITNKEVSLLSNAVSVYYPIAYTRTNDFDVWLSVLKKQIERVKLQNKSNKKVYAFVMPIYYAAHQHYDNNYIDPVFFARQLEEIYKYCDGIVLWHPPFDLHTRKTIFWNDKTAWWLEVQKFIKKYKITSNYGNKR